MSKPQQRKSGSGPKPRKRKRPHPEADKFEAGLPRASELARGDGTPGLLRDATQPQPHRSADFLIRGGVGNRIVGGGGTVRVEGGSRNRIIGTHVDRLDVSGDADVALEGVTIPRDGAVTAGVGSSITVKGSRVGGHLVAEQEVSTKRHGGLVTSQVATPAGAMLSAEGPAPDEDDNNRMVGEAIRDQLGKGHEVVPEEKHGEGATLRKGVCDPQVDVFLRAPASEDDDVRLQIIRLPSVTRQLGEHDAAVHSRFDDDAIREAVADKADVDGKEKLDLVVSCPFEVAAVMRAEFAKRRFDTRGYRRLWLVDLTRWAQVLGTRAE